MKPLLNIFVVFLIAAGVYFINSPSNFSKNTLPENKKAAVLAKYLTGFNKPKKIEINNITKRLSVEADIIKKVNYSLDDKSKFYVSIDLFTDENDASAPLIAQIKFFDIASNNKIKEENINLE